MFAELPVKTAMYNHAAGRVIINFRADQFQDGCHVSLLVDGTAHNSISQRIEAKGKTPERIEAVFNLLWLTSVSKEVLLISHINNKPAFYRYIPDQHNLKHWKVVNYKASDLSMVLSFPRSGSNFLQNVIRENTTEIGCTSIYHGSNLTTPKILLKSHALTPDVLRAELKTLWVIEEPGFQKIVLVRDPRDVFISLYDYVAVLRGAKVDPASFLMTDFYLHLYKPHMVPLVRGKETRALSVLQAYRAWYRRWINETVKKPGTLLVRFEDLVSDPQKGFAPVFKLLNKPMPQHLAATGDLVSQNGESLRRRGRAQGWREAPDMYRPIIDQINKKLADEIAYLGYGGTG